MTRTFIALEMNEAQQRHLEEVIHRVAQVLPSVRWVNPSSIHLTLAFLGELDDTRLNAAIDAAYAAASQVSVFSYSLSRVGIFGSPRDPRVIWIGIEERSGSLQRLQRILNQELVTRGFEVEKRPFSPHLTLARVKVQLPPDELQQLQALLKGPQYGLLSDQHYLVHHLDVMKSQLQRTGAHYARLETCPLQPGNREEV